MTKDRSAAKKPVEESSTSDEFSGEDPECSDEELEEAEELLNDVSATDSEEQSEETSAPVSDAETESGSEEKEDDETLRTVFIKDIDYDLKEDELEQQMRKLGEVVRVNIPMTHDQRRNKGFAYVEFKKLACAQKALKLDGTELLGRKVAVSQARPRENRKIHTVFVKNLNYGTTKADLMEYFNGFGKVYNITLPMDNENTERNKGFCFVEYTDYETARKVLDSEHKVNDRKLYLSEGAKNEERNQKRGSDRLYGRKGDERGGFRGRGDGDERGGFRGRNDRDDRGDRNDRGDRDSRPQRNDRFNKRRDDESDERGPKGGPRGRYPNENKSNGKGRPSGSSTKSNKIVFNDSE